MRKALKTIGKIVAFFMIWAVLGGLLDIPAEDPAIWRFWAEFVPFALIAVLSFLFWIFEKKRIPVFSMKHFGRNIAAGLAAGCLWIGIPVLILYISHVIAFTGINTVTMLPVWCLSCFLNVIMQELLVRGYIYQLLKKEYNLPVAFIISTALFTVMHGGAFEAGIIPVLCVVTMSLAMTAAMEYGGSLALPILLHSVWNILGAIVFNVIELADDYPHILNASISGSSILTGGSCLIEGSIVVLAINVLIAGAFVVLGRKNKAQF